MRGNDVTDVPALSDLERACDEYGRGVRVLATHRGPLIERLLDNGQEHLAAALPSNRRDPVPRTLANYMHPSDDLADDLQARMKDVLDQITALSGQYSLDPSVTSLLINSAEGVAGKVVDLSDDLRQQLSGKNRLTANRGPLDITVDELTRVPTDAELLVSSVWSEEHLIVLGRIIEISIQNEGRCRQLLGRALGLPESALEKGQYTDAVFLGSRLNDLDRRLKNLSKMDGVPTWMPAAIDWTDRAAKADKRRDALVHRPPAIILGRTGPRPALSPARNSQQVEELTTQAWELLRDLAKVSRDSFEILRISSTHSTLGSSSGPEAIPPSLGP